MVCEKTTILSRSCRVPEKAAGLINAILLSPSPGILVDKRDITNPARKET